MKAFLSTLCALLCVGAASANITVTGTGKVLYTPDLGNIIVGVSSEGKTANEAWNKNRELVARLFEVLKKNGILPKDMKTSNLAITPHYVEKDKKQVLVGYIASYDLAVVVRKLDELGTILDGLVENGANRNVSLSFGCSDMDKLTDQARRHRRGPQEGRDLCHRRRRPPRSCPDHQRRLCPRNVLSADAVCVRGQERRRPCPDHRRRRTGSVRQRDGDL